MSQLPMTIFTSAGLYFSAFLFFASALLLVTLYHFRWKSDLISLGLWLIVFAGAGVTTWIITDEPLAILSVIGINLFLVLCLCRLVRVISLFGVFFLASMLAPSIYGLIWLYELVMAANHYLNPPWFIYPILLLAESIFGVLIIFNTIMISWIMLMRYSPLYFRFPRLKKGWEKANIAKIHPWVSIHVPCYNEPPEIVIETLNALAQQRYSHFEVIVLDNNTKDPNIWKSVEEHCLKLGERFRFYHFDSLLGAKAGALNACLRLTSPQTELISVIDADYITQDDFLEKLVGFLNDPKVGFVQSCQDYRDWKNNSYLSACYFEYEVHFNLELSGQNEWDTAYTIGTTCLIRRKALEEAGGWAEWCLTEDSEIAVRIHALGYSGYYLKDALGYGLIPETFESYKQQRFRWTAGPVQQFQKHWRLYLPWFSEGRLTFAQKMGEIFHSLSIFLSEFLNLLVIIPLLGISLWFSITRDQPFILPLVILFLIPLAILRNIICNYLSIRLLGGNWKNYVLAALAARSLTFTRNAAFYKALFTKKLSWKRTDKFKATTSFWRAFSSSRTEMIAGSIYILLACFLAYFVSFKHPDIIFLIWLGIVNRAFSFFCAPFMAILSEKNLKK